METQHPSQLRQEEILAATLPSQAQLQHPSNKPHSSDSQPHAIPATVVNASPKK